MTEGEQKQQDYAIKRRKDAIRLGINSAIHAVTNIGIFSGKEFWQTDQDSWNAISNDAHWILTHLISLKTEIETIIGAVIEDEEEE